MKITFIGTSHGYPEPNRKCSCTLIEIRDKKYILDMGCNPVEYLTNVGIHVREIDAIFISHTHGDHTNGILPFTELTNGLYKDAKAEFYVPTLKVKDAVNGWKALNGAKLRENMLFHVISEGIIFDDGNLKVSAFRNKHMEKSYSFMFEAEGKKVFFTNDLGPNGGQGEFQDMIRECYDLIVGEGVHFSPLDYKEGLMKYPPKLMYITHYATRNLKDIMCLVEDMKEIVCVKIATDGLCIEV